MMRFLIIILIPLSLYASNFEITKADSEDILQGVPFEGVIRLWPYHNLDDGFLKSLAGKNLDNTLYIVNVTKYSRSENNYDVFEIYGTFILMKEKIPPVISINNENYEVKKLKSNVLKPKSVSKEVIVLDHQIQDQKSLWLLYILIFIGASVLLYIISRVFKMLKAKKDLRSKRMSAIEKMKKAESRKQLEELYFDLQKMETLFENINSSDFKKEIENCLYVKSWNDETYQNLKTLKKKMESSIRGV